MSKQDRLLFWTLYGVVVAFLVQFIYDLFGVLGPAAKLLGGMLIAMAAVIIILLWGRRLKEL